MHLSLSLSLPPCIYIYSMRETVSGFETVAIHGIVGSIPRVGIPTVVWKTQYNHTPTIWTWYLPPLYGNIGMLYSWVYHINTFTYSPAWPAGSTSISMDIMFHHLPRISKNFPRFSMDFPGLPMNFPSISMEFPFILQGKTTNFPSAPRFGRCGIDPGRPPPSPPPSWPPPRGAAERPWGPWRRWHRQWRPWGVKMMIFDGLLIVY